MADAETLLGPLRDRLAVYGRERRFRRGDNMFDGREAINDVMVIRSGLVKVFTIAPSGREVIIEVMEEGDIVGLLSAIDGDDTTGGAVALTDVDVLSIPQDVFRQRLDDDMQLARLMIRVLTMRLRAAVGRFVEFGANDALGRLCVRFVELARRNGWRLERAGGNVTAITLPMSQQELASWVGVSREAVVKGLNSLRRLGWIETNGRDVYLLDFEAVSRRAFG